MPMSRDDETPPPSEIDDLFRLVDRLPFLGSLARDLKELRRLLYDRRAPRIAAIGVAASGKTTLANALLHVPALPTRASPASPPDTWIRIDAGGRHLHWLEVDAGGIDDARRGALRRAIDEGHPDVILVVARAGDLAGDAAVAREALAVVLGMLDDGTKKGAAPPIVAALTCAHALGEPASSEGTITFAPEVVAALDAAIASLGKKLGADGGPAIARSVPVIAHGTTTHVDARWNVSVLADALLTALPDATKVEAVRALEVPVEARRELARGIVNRCAAAAVTVGLMPIPFSDAILLLPLQGMMVSAVAYVAGQPWDRRAAAEWLGSVGVMGGAAFGLRWGAQQLAKLVPGAGMLISGSVAGTGTLAIGRSAIAYFVDGPGRRRPLALLPADL